jgi:hypothetical protein
VVENLDEPLSPAVIGMFSGRERTYRAENTSVFSEHRRYDSEARRQNRLQRGVHFSGAHNIEFGMQSLLGRKVPVLRRLGKLLVDDDFVISSIKLGGG